MGPNFRTIISERTDGALNFVRADARHCKKTTKLGQARRLSETLFEFARIFQVNRAFSGADPRGP